jgi:hypothetical protein
MGTVLRSRRARPRTGSRTDGAIHLNMPPETGFKKANLFLALGLLAALTVSPLPTVYCQPAMQK